MKTRDDIGRLKRAWHSDPCWDIEKTPGFEDHRLELREYRLEYEERRRQETEQEELSIAYSLGSPGNIRLARYVKSLEIKLETITVTLKQLEFEISELRAKVAP